MFKSAICFTNLLILATLVFSCPAVAQGPSSDANAPRQQEAKVEKSIVASPWYNEYQEIPDSQNSNQLPEKVEDRRPLTGSIDVQVQDQLQNQVSEPNLQGREIKQDSRTQLFDMRAQQERGLMSMLKNMLNGAINQQTYNIPIERPTWIPGYAYTNQYMIAPYHNMNTMWWDKSSMPDRAQMVQLATSVTRFWRGQVTQPCFVRVEPFIQAPGNYIFHSRFPGGPKGWLQALNVRDNSGFPLYRYWFDPN